jgi:endonuclease/exonuclease/phosphatase family metal-dependent hydrolase
MPTAIFLISCLFLLATALSAAAADSLTPEQKAALAALDVRIAAVEAVAAKIDDTDYQAEVVKQIKELKDRRRGVERNFDQASYEALMHNVISRYQIAALWLKSPPLPPRVLPIRLRVLSYNVHHCEGTDGNLDIERIAQVVRSVEPDLVALQEVDQKAQRSQSVDQPAEIARLTKMHVVFGANIPLQGGSYGNAVLSRFPIKSHTNHKLTRFDNGEQRGVLEVYFELSGLRHPLLFLATHLDHRPNNEERLASAQAILEIMADQPDRPALLAGDLNDIPDSAVLNRFGQQWGRANANVLPTIPVANPRRQIDYILLRPSARWRVVEAKVIDESVASDHRPIFATLELLPDSD